jgi:hypothetical protein
MDSPVQVSRYGEDAKAFQSTSKEASPPSGGTRNRSVGGAGILESKPFLDLHCLPASTTLERAGFESLLPLATHETENLEIVDG